MMIFEFEWDGKCYTVEGTPCSLDCIVLPDTRKVVKITEWYAVSPPIIADLILIPHSLQESLTQEIAIVFNAAIATIAEPKKLEIPEEE